MERRIEQKKKERQWKSVNKRNAGGGQVEKYEGERITGGERNGK